MITSPTPDNECDLKDYIQSEMPSNNRNRNPSLKESKGLMKNGQNILSTQAISTDRSLVQNYKSGASHHSLSPQSFSRAIQ